MKQPLWHKLVRPKCVFLRLSSESLHIPFVGDFFVFRSDTGGGQEIMLFPIPILDPSRAGIIGKEQLPAKAELPKSTGKLRSVQNHKSLPIHENKPKSIISSAFLKNIAFYALSLGAGLLIGRLLINAYASPQKKTHPWQKTAVAMKNRAPLGAFDVLRSLCYFENR